MTNIDISELIVEPTKIAKFIDSTNLRPDATFKDIEKLCYDAIKYHFLAVCVNPCYVEFCSKILKASPVKICTVCGFPLGANLTETKIYEAQRACQGGAHEIDMVINIGALKSGNYKLVESDVSSIAKTLKSGIILKVILETGLLTKEEKIKGCEVAKNSGAHFVKTSTGFSQTGATVEDVKLLRQTVGDDFGVKASGGIKDLKIALDMLRAGANRIGTSSAVKIISEKAYLEKL